MKRVKAPARKAPLKRGRPKQHRKKRKARVQDHGRWNAPPLAQCRKCGAARMIDRHHVVYAQHVAYEGGDTSDPDNQIALCRQCHDRLHNERSFPTSLLPDQAINFAVRLLGAGGAYEYLTRYYQPDGDPRVAWLLEQWEAER